MDIAGIRLFACWRWCHNCTTVRSGCGEVEHRMSFANTMHGVSTELLENTLKLVKPDVILRGRDGKGQARADQNE